MRNIGIDVKPPTKSCDDPECPFHGSLSVRGKILEGKVVSNLAKKMIVIEREYLHYVKKYMRYERRRSKIHAHLPPCIEVARGDRVIIGECRPLAKTVSFVVLGKVEG
ncbi:MAG: 30S ribosomal protein S17 [Nitrososphaerales archaeon]|nr:30S ribosomal protein S17 [Nitrososphaerales archaeon]